MMVWTSAGSEREVLRVGDEDVEAEAASTSHVASCGFETKEPISASPRPSRSAIHLRTRAPAQLVRGSSSEAAARASPNFSTIR